MEEGESRVRDEPLNRLDWAKTTGERREREGGRELRRLLKGRRRGQGWRRTATVAVVGRWRRKSGRRAAEAAAMSRQLSRGKEGEGRIRTESAEMVEREDMGREISVGFFMHGETPASQPQHELRSSMVCRFHPALRLVHSIRSAPLQWYPQEALRGDVIRTDRSMMLARSL